MPEETNRPGTGENRRGNPELAALEAAYRKALAAFKAAPPDGPQKKDLRRARSAAKKARDEALLADALRTDPGAKALQCRDCSQMFVWTTEDRNYYRAAERMWNHQPARCRVCAGSQKARRKQNQTQTQNQTPEGENGEASSGGVGGRAGKNMCYAFQRGECRYGDRCKFNHDPNFAGKNSEIENSSNNNNDNNNDNDNDDDGENHRSSARDGDNEEESGGATPKKRKIAPEDVPICKWGTRCTVKKCRYRHVDDETAGDDSRANDPKASGSGSGADSEPATKKTAPESGVKKRKVAPAGICKWGKNCRLKRCRLRHEDAPSSPSETKNSDAHSNKKKDTDANTNSTVCVVIGSESSGEAPKTVSANKENGNKSGSVSESGSTKTKSEKTAGKKSEKTAIKVLRKALKKAPERQLRVRELRKLIESKLEAVGKDRAKLLIRDAVASHKDQLVLVEKGKIVRLL